MNDDTTKSGVETGELSDEQLDAVSGGSGRSDLGQQLQLQLQEANNIYTRSTQPASNVTKSHQDTQNAVISKIG